MEAGFPRDQAGRVQLADNIVTLPKNEGVTQESEYAKEVPDPAYRSQQLTVGTQQYSQEQKAPDVYGTPPVSGVPVGADWASRPQTFPKMAREQWIMTAEQKRAFGESPGAPPWQAPYISGHVGPYPPKRHRRSDSPSGSHTRSSRRRRAARANKYASSDSMFAYEPDSEQEIKLPRRKESEHDDRRSLYVCLIIFGLICTIIIFVLIISILIICKDRNANCCCSLGLCNCTEI